MNTVQDTRKPRRAFHAMRRGLSLLDLLAALFLIFIPQLPAAVVTAHYGIERGLQAGVVSVLACWVLIAAISCWSYSCYHETLRVLSERYPSIYRVKEIPTDTSRFWIAEGAMIEIGDYGWEAVPLHNDGLIYLQGLSEKWGVVWYAGFRSDQIESVGRKPRTQYLIPKDWYRVGLDAFPCPFPIQSRPTADLGMPEHHQGSLDCLADKLRESRQP